MSGDNVCGSGRRWWGTEGMTIIQLFDIGTLEGREDKYNGKNGFKVASTKYTVDLRGAMSEGV